MVDVVVEVGIVVAVVAVVVVVFVVAVGYRSHLMSRHRVVSCRVNSSF